MKQGFIDIHSHILPGVDDGSQSMEMSLRMIGMSYAQGVRSMIATPHYYPGHKNVDHSQIFDVYTELKEQSRKVYPDFQLLLGQEIYYKDIVIDLLKKKKIYTMAESRYILIEFQVNVDYRQIYSAARKCIEAGYYPILAHVERYVCLHKNSRGLEELAKLGVYMQVNAENFRGSLFGRDRNNCLKLIRNGYVQFIGSDCHNLNSRKPDMIDAAKYLGNRMDPASYQAVLYENPSKIPEDQYL